MLAPYPADVMEAVRRLDRRQPRGSRRAGDGGAAGTVAPRGRAATRAAPGDVPCTWPRRRTRRPHHQDHHGFGQSAEEVERRCRSDHGHAEATHLVSIAPRAERASGAVIVVHDGHLHGMEAVPSSGHLARRPGTPCLGFTLHAVRSRGGRCSLAVKSPGGSPVLPYDAMNGLDDRTTTPANRHESSENHIGSSGSIIGRAGEREA